MIYNFNGVLSDNNSLSVELHNRALLYGDGVFETLKYAFGKILFWEDHYFRLMASMRILRIRIPDHWTPEFLQNQILETISACHWEKQSVRVRLTVWRSGGGRYKPESHMPEFLITCTLLESGEYLIPCREIRVDLYKDVPKTANLLSGLKLIGSQIYVLAAIFANDNDLWDVLLINDSKNIVESSRSNVFVVSGDQLITPPLHSGALRGILRQRLIRSAREIGLTAVERDISPFDLLRVDELWLTNVIQGIIPVSEYRSKKFNDSKAKSMVNVLNALARRDTFDLSF